VLSGGLLPEERNGPRVVHDGVRVLRDGVRELLGGAEEGLEERDGLFARGGKRVQARGGDIVGNGSRLCLQGGQHGWRYVRWVFCHDDTMVVGDGRRVSASAARARDALLVALILESTPLSCFNTGLVATSPLPRITVESLKIVR